MKRSQKLKAKKKNAEISKIKNKLDATKKFFANANKLIVSSPVTRDENSVQYEEKTKKPKRRRSGKLCNTGSLVLMSPKEGMRKFKPEKSESAYENFLLLVF